MAGLGNCQKEGFVGVATTSVSDVCVAPSVGWDPHKQLGGAILGWSHLSRYYQILFSAENYWGQIPCVEGAHFDPHLAQHSKAQAPW